MRGRYHHREQGGYFGGTTEETKSLETVGWEKGERRAFTSVVNLLANSKLVTKVNVG